MSIPTNEDAKAKRGKTKGSSMKLNRLELLAALEASGGGGGRVWKESCLSEEARRGIRVAAQNKSFCKYSEINGLQSMERGLVIYGYEFFPVDYPGW